MAFPSSSLQCCSWPRERFGGKPRPAIVTTDLPQQPPGLWSYCKAESDCASIDFPNIQRDAVIRATMPPVRNQYQMDCTHRQNISIRSVLFNSHEDSEPRGNIIFPLLTVTHPGRKRRDHALSLLPVPRSLPVSICPTHTREPSLFLGFLADRLQVHSTYFCRLSWDPGTAGWSSMNNDACYHTKFILMFPLDLLWIKGAYGCHCEESFGNWRAALCRHWVFPYVWYLPCCWAGLGAWAPEEGLGPDGWWSSGQPHPLGMELGRSLWESAQELIWSKGLTEKWVCNLIWANDKTEGSLLQAFSLWWASFWKRPSPLSDNVIWEARAGLTAVAEAWVTGRSLRIL